MPFSVLQTPSLGFQIASFLILAPLHFNFDSREEEFKFHVRELESKKKQFEDQVKEFEGR